MLWDIGTNKNELNDIEMEGVPENIPNGAENVLDRI